MFIRNIPCKSNMVDSPTRLMLVSPFMEKQQIDFTDVLTPTEPRKKYMLPSIYWLFKRDPYNGLLMTIIIPTHTTG